MSENPLKGSIDIPKVGKVPKWAVIGIGGAGLAYVGYRWWQSSSQSNVPDTVDPGYADPGTIPSVSGGDIGSGEGGIPSSGGGEPPNASDYGFTGTTNDQWSQYATIQLTQSGQWEYTGIVTALGQFLARKPLSSDQVKIVRAAIAVAGYPPEGSYTVITSGGDTTHIVAPQNVRVVGTTSTTVTIRWDAVPGADNYKVYANGSYAEMGGTDLISKVEGLQPDTTYAMTVTALNVSGTEGPQSSPASAHTGKKAAEPTPSQPSHSSGGHRTWRISNTYPTLSELVAGYNRHYHTHFSWRQIWDYNLAHRSSSTVKTLKKRGPDHVYHGSSFWFPK